MRGVCCTVPGLATTMVKKYKHQGGLNNLSKIKNALRMAVHKAWPAEVTQIKTVIIMKFNFFSKGQFKSNMLLNLNSS